MRKSNLGVLAAVLVFALYGIVLWGLPANKFEVLYIVPLLASGWAISMIVLLIKTWKSLWASMSGSKGSTMQETAEYVEHWENEPRDTFWYIHTISLVAFALYYFGVIIFDLITR